MILFKAAVAASTIGLAVWGSALAQTEVPKAIAPPSFSVTASALATWSGTWKEGAGTVSTKSSMLKDVPYSFASRFEGAPGASPEELLAAALVGCFNQALVNNVGMNKLVAQSVESSADVEFGYDENGRPVIKALHVTVDAKVPGGSEELFQQSAKRASTNCTIARALKVEVGLTARLIP